MKKLIDLKLRDTPTRKYLTLDAALYVANNILLFVDNSIVEFSSQEDAEDVDNVLEDNLAEIMYNSIEEGSNLTVELKVKRTYQRHLLSIGTAFDILAEKKVFYLDYDGGVQHLDIENVDEVFDVLLNWIVYGVQG